MVYLRFMLQMWMMVSEVKQQMSSADVGVVIIPTMKCIVDSTCVELGKVIEEGNSIIILVDILTVYFIINLVPYMITYLTVDTGLNIINM